MTEDCGGSSTVFSVARNGHHQHEHYDEEAYDTEAYMDVKYDREAESIYTMEEEEEEEEASVSEMEEHRRNTPARNRGYTFIMRPKAQTYVCEYCNKQLRYKSKYLEHLRIHTGERPFTCRYCSASFTQNGALKQHERIHTGSKPHYCLSCNKSFRTASSLNVHLKSHPNATDTVIAGFSTTLEDPYFEDHARIDEELAYEAAQQQQQLQLQEEEEEYVEIYEPTESEEFTHRWHVSHVTQPDVDATQISPESDLRIARFADGRLQINDIILEPEHFPTDGVSMYYYTLTNNEILTFMYDNANDTLEIVESNDGVAEADVEVIPHEVEVPHYEEHFEESEGPYEVYEEVIPESAVAGASSEYELVYDNGQRKAGPKTHHPAQYIIDPAQVIDIEHVNELQEGAKELITVVADSREMAPEMVAVNNAFFPPTRRKVYPPLQKEHVYPLQKEQRKPKNLEWIINAVAAGKKLEDATPHKRKKPTIKECEICGLTLKYPSKIAAHMRTHSGEKPFVCDICGRGFAMNTTLRMHVRRHLKEKEFRCTFPNCDKSFVSGALLNYHYQNRHFSRRKFACLRGCGLTFFSNKERERHEKVCIPSMEDGDDHLEYEEFVNPETGETEKWVFNGYSEESWENNDMVIEESGQVQMIEEHDEPY